MTMTGTALGYVCLEVQTEECICIRRRCGGVDIIRSECPEHSDPIDPHMRYHSHPVQAKRKPVYRAIRA